MVLSVRRVMCGAWSAGPPISGRSATRRCPLLAHPVTTTLVGYVLRGKATLYGRMGFQKEMLA